MENITIKKSEKKGKQKDTTIGKEVKAKKNLYEKDGDREKKTGRQRIQKTN